MFEHRWMKKRIKNQFQIQYISTLLTFVLLKSEKMEKKRNCKNVPYFVANFLTYFWTSNIYLSCVHGDPFVRGANIMIKYFI